VAGVRQQVEEIIGQGQHAPGGHIPFTPRAKKRRTIQSELEDAVSERILFNDLRPGQIALVDCEGDPDDPDHARLVFTGTAGQESGSRNGYSSVMCSPAP
jgi:hypothetical protein